MFDPLFTVFGLEVQPFSLCACAAAFAAVSLFLCLGAKRNYPRYALEKCALAAVPLAVFCGHLLFCVVLWNDVIPSYGWRILTEPRQGGFMFYGAAAGAAGAVFFAGRRYRKPFFDLTALSLLTVILCLRFAEPLDGQGHGINVDDFPAVHFFPVAFPNPEWPDEWNLAVFFWEGLYALGVLVFLLLTLKKRAPGDTALTALILYAAGQVIFESLRRDEVVRWLFVRVSQLISALILASVVILAIVRGARGRRGAVLMGLTLLFIGAIIALEFAVEKPLLLPGHEPIYFSLPLTYSLITLCAFGLGAVAMTAKGAFFPNKTD